MVSSHLHTGSQLAVFPDRRKMRFLVKLNDKIILKITRYPTAVLRRITDYFILLRDDTYIRTFVKSIDNDTGRVRFRKSKPETSCPLRRDKLRCYIIISQIYTVIIRSHGLGLMRKPTGPLILIDSIPDYRHQGKLPVIIYPRTRLMRLLKPSYPVLVITISPSVAHLSGLRNPKIHAPRHCNRRICITGRQLECRQRPHQRVHIIDRRKPRCRQDSHITANQKPPKKSFQLIYHIHIYIIT